MYASRCSAIEDSTKEIFSRAILIVSGLLARELNYALKSFLLSAKGLDRNLHSPPSTIFSKFVLIENTLHSVSFELLIAPFAVMLITLHFDFLKL